MSDKVQVSVRDRAKLFEPVNPAGRLSSNHQEDKYPGNNPHGSAETERRVSQRPPVFPKPNINLNEILSAQKFAENDACDRTSSGISENSETFIGSVSGPSSAESEPDAVTNETTNDDHFTSNELILHQQDQQDDNCQPTLTNSVVTESTGKDETIDFGRKIEMTVAELVSTEETYLKILDVLINKFPAAMVGLANGEPSVDTIKGVLRIEDLKPIQVFHSDHLYPQFKERLNNWGTHPYISDIILKAVKFFKVYSSFVVNQSTVIKEFDGLTEYFPEFKKAVVTFLAETASDPSYSDIKSFITFRFAELLKKPHSRLFQYKNLLERYAKELDKAPAEFPGKSDLEGAHQAIAEMDSVICHLNAQMQKEEENLNFQKQLSNLRAKLYNAEEFFLDKELKLVREGLLQKRSRKADQLRYVVLFDTYLIVAKPHLTGNSYSIKYAFQLQTAQANVDERDSRSFVLSVPWPQTSSTFRTSSPKECDAWVQEINECKRRLVPSDPLVNNGNQPLCLPPWKPDHMFTCCTLCAKRFHTTNLILTGKHHCRMCGLVYCEACSKQKWAVSGSLLRVCDICHEILQFDECPEAELPAIVLDQVGTRSVWEAKTHAEKWYLYKDELFSREDSSGHRASDLSRSSASSSSVRQVPYLRQIIAASKTCSRSGYLYMLDMKTYKFVLRWVVIEQNCLVIFEACQNTVALERHFLAGFRFEGPTVIPDDSALKQSADSVAVKFVFACFHENYNNLAAEMSQKYQSPTTGSRRMSSMHSSSIFSFFTSSSNRSSTSSSVSGGSSSRPYFLFGVNEDYEAEDWIKELQQIKRHSELTSTSS